jgi:hypothetical protein
MKHFGRQRRHGIGLCKQHWVILGLSGNHPEASRRVFHRCAFRKGIGQGSQGLPTPISHLEAQAAPISHLEAQAALLAHRLHYVKQVSWAMLNVNQASELIMNLEYPQAIISGSTITDQYVYVQPPNTCTLP